MVSLGVRGVAGLGAAVPVKRVKSIGALQALPIWRHFEVLSLDRGTINVQRTMADIQDQVHLGQPKSVATSQHVMMSIQPGKVFQAGTYTGNVVYTAAADRIQCSFRLKNLLEEYFEDIARTVTMEYGKKSRQHD